jgi:hypothetical protein
MKPRSNHLCYNCGIREATTLDHVISKTLIPEPRPNNLVTVPACKECNGGFSKDEEYVRDRLSAAIGGEDFGAPVTWDKAWRSMQRPKAKGKKFGLFKEIFKLPAPVVTKDGPSDMGVLMNKQRVNRVVEKMVRGFYLHHFNTPLGDVNFDIDILSNINSRGGDRRALLECVQEAYASPTWAQNFGDYTHVVCELAEEDDRAGLWVFKLLGQHFVVALVAPNGYFEKDQSGKRLSVP